MRTNLLIVAAGEGTRAAMFTMNNAMPKCMMSVGDKTCIEAILASYAGQVDKAYIVCLRQHAGLIAKLLEEKGVDKTFGTVDCIPIDPQPSALASIRAAFKLIHAKEADAWYLNWSDVFADKVPRPAINTIYTDTQYRHRNLAVMTGNDLVTCVSTSNLSGNVPGIFYTDTNSMLEALAYDEEDFDKAITEVAACKTLAMDVHDIGDYAKYTAFMTKRDTDSACRYFNRIEIKPTTVIKQAVTPLGIELQRAEVDFYMTYGNRCGCMPKLISYDSAANKMTLERVKGRTVQQALDKCIGSKVGKANRLISKFKGAIAGLQALQPVELLDNEQDLRAAIFDELVSMLDKRVKPCKALIDTVILKNGIKSIEGKPIRPYEEVYNAVQAYVEANIDQFHACITHGDTNTDNTMLSTQGDIKFIDPRGRFGKLKTAGLGFAEYDLAKFVYGMTGYSRFNSASYIATEVKNGDLKVYLSEDEEGGVDAIDIDSLAVPELIKVIVGIIWMKLTSYIINDPAKSVVAYLHGNAMLTKLLNL